jgi:hypothetical protein
MKYKLTSRREEAVTIDGLGVLPPATRDAETNELVPSVLELDGNDDRVKAFEHQRGMKLLYATMPEGVEGWVEV